MELNDGTIVTGKTSSLLGASAALLLNAIKAVSYTHLDVYKRQVHLPWSSTYWVATCPLAKSL